MSALNIADDGDWLSPRVMAAKLAELTAGGDVVPDYYGVGGPVTLLEEAMARLLGKEAAVMYPTGTLANLMAMRAIARGKSGSRVIVHRDSHIFNDAGDNFTHSAHVTMLPLAADAASFSDAQLRAEISRTAGARVPAAIAAIMIETPSRRHANRRFDDAAMAGIIASAKAEGIPLVLDGARIFIEAAWTGRSPAEIAAPFDYVYVSLYKYLDAPFGAVLLGPAAPLAGQQHERRRYGGGLFQMWPAALLAHNALSRQETVWREVRRKGEAVAEALRREGALISRYADDTNALRVAIQGGDEAFRARCRERSVKPPPFAGGIATLKMNETWLARDEAEIVATIGALLA